jgi:hypothetical protein
MTDDNDGILAPAGRVPRVQIRPVHEAGAEQPGAEESAAGDEDDEPQELITTIFVSRIEDVIEAIRAADTLGLGVRVHNRWVTEEVDTVLGDTLLGDWVVDLFTDGLHVGN